MAQWQGDFAKPLVSICCTAYNHERFIEDALEGFLIQKTDFPFEILIHDDASKDRTAEIIRSYEAAFPNILKPIYQTENQYSQGKKPGRLNSERAKGKYIALCEGDDYWTDEKKLNKQVSFLNKNIEYSACCHQSIIKYEDDNLESRLFRQNNADIYLNDLMSGRIFHTASFMFRSCIVKNNTAPNDILSGDRYLFLLCALFGKIRFLEDSMCIYRKHEGGISNWITYDLLKQDLNIPRYLSMINNDFPKNKYLSFIHQTLISYPKKIPFDKYIYHYAMYLILSFSTFPRNLKGIIKYSLRRLPVKMYRYISSKD